MHIINPEVQHNIPNEKWQWYDNNVRNTMGFTVWGKLHKLNYTGHTITNTWGGVSLVLGAFSPDKLVRALTTHNREGKNQLTGLESRTFIRIQLCMFPNWPFRSHPNQQNSGLTWNMIHQKDLTRTVKCQWSRHWWVMRIGRIASCGQGNAGETQGLGSSCITKCSRHDQRRHGHSGW